MTCDNNTDLFFFSSRRRHTRFDCDWSSDVCSSDLEMDPRRPVELRGGSAGGLLMNCLFHKDLSTGAEQHWRSEEHTSELQSQSNLVCRLLLEKKKEIAIQ